MDGRPECVGLSVAPASAGEALAPLSESVIRKAGIAQIIATERAKLLARSSPTAGLRGSTRRRLEQVASVYNSALSQGMRPNKAVQEAMGTTPGYAANLVAQARGAGLLPPTSAGVALGEAGRPPGKGESRASQE
ncbi:hypothetical protein E1091_07490 [Micromonospora fluostatini]|uniref:Uncharacterized protein n=2 Tax=Micromonospora TaxID=1873 RepID=A0ABY2DIZ7_9ACTN|nr:hypothetical protein E1091_07490 [Micromonospora fluostatini]